MLLELIPGTIQKKSKKNRGRQEGNAQEHVICDCLPTTPGLLSLLHLFGAKVWLCGSSLRSEMKKSVSV